MWDMALPIVSSLIQSNSASNASNAQAASAAAASAAQERSAAASLAEQQRQYNQTRQDFAPQRQTGNAALAKLSDYLGLTTPQTAQPAQTSGGGVAVGGFGGIGGALGGMSGAIQQALGTTSAQAPAGTAMPQKTREQIRSELLSQYSTPGTYGMINYMGGDSPEYGYGAPTVNEAGLNAAVDQAMTQQATAQPSAQTAQQQMAADGFTQIAPNANTGSLLKQFTGESVATDPGYQFGLTEGQKAINNRLNAGGSMYGGAAIKAAGRFGNDYATTKFGEAYNRDAADKGRIHGMLSGVAGTGQTATSQVASAGQNLANQTTGINEVLGKQTGSNLLQAGNANASNYLAQGTIIGNAINQGISQYNRSNQNAFQMPTSPYSNYQGDYNSLNYTP